MAENIGFVGGINVHQAWSRLMHILVHSTTRSQQRQVRARARIRHATRYRRA